MVTALRVLLGEWHRSDTPQGDGTRSFGRLSNRSSRVPVGVGDLDNAETAAALTEAAIARLIRDGRIKTGWSKVSKL